jgi:hypothetical protein
MMLSVSPCYQFLFITPSVFSSIYDVCISVLSIILDYPFGVSNVYDVFCVFRLSITLDYPFGVSNVYDVVCISRLSITLDYPFGVL